MICAVDQDFDFRDAGSVCAVFSGAFPVIFPPSRRTPGRVPIRSILSIRRTRFPARPVAAIRLRPASGAGSEIPPPRSFAAPVDFSLPSVPARPSLSECSRDIESADRDPDVPAPLEPPCRATSGGPESLPRPAAIAPAPRPRFPPPPAHDRSANVPATDRAIESSVRLHRTAAAAPRCPDPAGPADRPLRETRTLRGFAALPARA